MRSKAVPDTKDYGLFIDGGVTPHNNPSFALLQMTMLKPFRICWPLGPDKLSVTSIGTGTFRARLSYRELGVTRFAQLAYHALMSLMTDAEIMVLAQMQWLGECPAPWVINSEIGTLADDGPPGGKMFRFVRYDVRLEQEWLKRPRRDRHGRRSRPLPRHGRSHRRRRTSTRSPRRPPRSRSSRSISSRRRRPRPRAAPYRRRKRRVVRELDVALYPCSGWIGRWR